MNDSISRQEAINAILHYTIRIPGYMSEWGRKLIAAIKEDLMDEINAIPPSQQWTPCSNGLPKAGVRYQVTFESGEVGYADFRNRVFLLDGSVKENVWKIEQYYEDEGGVVAWMPKPEPYKGEVQ